MSKRKTTILVVEDIEKFQTDPFVVEVEINFENITFRENPNEALSFVKENLETKIIIMLDLMFPAYPMDGLKFLKELRNLSKLIPVIVWSGKGNNIDGTEYQKMINDSTFAFLSKSASSEEIVNALCKADDYLNS